LKKQEILLVSGKRHLWLVSNQAKTPLKAPKSHNRSKSSNKLSTACENARAVLQIREMLNGISFNAEDIWRLAYDEPELLP